MSTIDLSSVDQAKLLEQLDALLAHSDFVEKARTYGVQAVGVFRSAEGGLVVKYQKGSGFVDVAGGRQGAPLDLESYSVGAVAGGSATQGVVVFVGAPDELALNGEYKGAVAQAAAVTESTTSVVTLQHQKHGHYAYIVSIGQGLTADAGGAKIRFSIGG